MPTNPYLKDGRLAEVIAAITATGNYRYYKLDYQGWAERIANKPEEAQHWGNVLSEHPEFFRVDPVGPLLCGDAKTLSPSTRENSGI